LEHAENLRAVRRTVNTERDRAAQAMLEMLEMLERHGSRTGTVYASIPGPTVFRSGALPVKGLELVVGRRRLCGDLSPESALAILQKPPPDAVWTQDQTHTITSIFGPSDGTNFLERHYLKAQDNSIGHL
jgi:hypothetical protein